MLYSIDFNFIPKQRLFEVFNIQFEIEGEKMGELTTEELSLWERKQFVMIKNFGCHWLYI